MRKELIEKLLSAAQDVVNDATELDEDREGNIVTTVDDEAFSALKAVVQQISTEALERIEAVVEAKGAPVYEVVVGNIGRVFIGTDEANAKMAYDDYVHASRQPHGRAAGESVVLMKDDDIAQEFFGSLSEEE